MVVLNRIHIYFFQFVQITCHSGKFHGLEVHLQCYFTLICNSYNSGLNHGSISHRIFIGCCVEQFDRYGICTFKNLRIFFKKITLLVLNNKCFIRRGQQFCLLFYFCFCCIDISGYFLSRFDCCLETVPTVVCISAVICLGQCIFDIAI